jgi:uncharacterized protein (TIGR02246 family)
VLVTLVVAALLQAAPPASSRGATVPADARAAIARANDDWLPAMQRQDAKAIVEPYADDGVFVMPTGEAVKGRAAIEQLMRDRFARTGRVLGGSLQQDDLVAVGSMIYEWGHAELELAGAPGQRPSRSVGRYLTVWKKDATGRWRIIRNLSLGD